MIVPTRLEFLNKSHIFIFTKDKELQKNIYSIYKQNRFFTKDLFCCLNLLIKNIYTIEKTKSMYKYISMCDTILTLHFPICVFSKKIKKGTNKAENGSNTVVDSIFKSFDYTHTEEISIKKDITEVLNLNTKINTQNGYNKIVSEIEEISKISKNLSMDYFLNNYPKWSKYYNDALLKDISNKIIINNKHITSTWKKYINMSIAMVLTCSYSIIDSDHKRRASNDLILLTSVLIPFLLIKNSTVIYNSRLRLLNKNNYFLASNRLLVNRKNKYVLVNLLSSYEKSLFQIIKEIYPKKYRLIWTNIKKIIK